MSKEETQKQHVVKRCREEITFLLKNKYSLSLYEKKNDKKEKKG